MNSADSARELTIAAPGWGIRFDRPTLNDGGLSLSKLPVPSQLIVPLLQHAGDTAQPLVAPGDRVLRGQPVADVAAGQFGAAVHAPTSGTVTSIGPHPTPGRGLVPSLFITADGLDTPWTGYNAFADPLKLPPDELLRAIGTAGIVGLGGASFPTLYKLNRGNKIGLLIVNGVECEPRINCDDVLLREQAASILLGAQLVLRIVGATDCIVAIKADARPTIAALRTALARLGDERIRLALVPSIYPAGGEAQLVQLLTGREIPAGGLPTDSGVVCHNVGTLAAIARFMTTGEPLISRIVTVTGTGVARPLNVEARIGTPVSELIRAAGGYTSTAVQIVMGGPMMGIPLPSDDVPVTKACNCLYVEPATAMSKPLPEMPCIRCGDCATACPATLTPQLLLLAQRTSDFDKLQELGLSECIEFGCCDYVFPSPIPLTEKFVPPKRVQQDQALERQRAHAAESRFIAHEERVYRRALERAQQAATLDRDPALAKAELQALLDRVADKTRDGDA